MALLQDDKQAPPAPPAPGVRSIVGSGQQNNGSTVAAAAAGQPQAMSTQAAIAQPDKPESNVSAARSVTSTASQASTTQSQTQQPSTGTAKTPPPAPTPRYDARPNPRTPQYYANLQALNATFNADLIMLQGAQDEADQRYDQETAIQKEYQRRQQRDLAEARLGTGSAYSGAARRERARDRFDYAIEQARRQFDKDAADKGRNLERFAIEGRRGKAIADLDAEYARSLAESFLDESQTSAGDRKYTPNYSGQIKGINKRIEVLRNRKKKSNNPRQQARIQGKIDKLKKRRTNVSKKAKETTSE